MTTDYYSLPPKMQRQTLETIIDQQGSCSYIDCCECPFADRQVYNVQCHNISRHDKFLIVKRMLLEEYIISDILEGE